MEQRAPGHTVLDGKIYWKGMLDFKKDIREHFAIEEKVLFPVMKKVLKGEELSLLLKIEEEHAPILNKLDGFSVVADNHTRYASKATREQMVQSACEIIEMVSAHASREDKLLFPLVGRHFRSEDLRELEDLYFKFLKV